MKRRNLLKAFGAAFLGVAAGSVNQEKEASRAEENEIEEFERAEECWGLWLQEGTEEVLPSKAGNYTASIQEVHHTDIFGERAELKIYDEDKDKAYYFNKGEEDYIRLPTGYIEIGLISEGRDEGFVSLRYTEGC